MVLLGLCAGGLAVGSAVSGIRENAAGAREARELRDQACLELETRLNRLVPPGAEIDPQARAQAVRDENVALRIYLEQVGDEETLDGWRQLVDARTQFADALDGEQADRTPAFFVAPRTDSGDATTDSLLRRSPAACSGAIRRLSSPDL